MSRKILFTFQKIAIGGFSRVSCGVKAEIGIPQTSNIPRMIGIARYAEDYPGIHTKLQDKTVKQRGISLTDSGFIDQRSIWGILEIIAPVGFIIVGHIGTDIVVNSPDFRIIIG